MSNKQPNYIEPTYFEGFVTYDNEKYFEKMIPIEWRGQIKSSSDNTKFRIKFYGELMKESFAGYKISDDGLIVGTDFSESLIVAEDAETNEQILLFDGCKHGYNAMFCDEFTKEQLEDRPLENIFRDCKGNEIFEVIVKVYHNIDYDDEMEDFLNDNNQIELISGELISTEKLKRDGFDFISIDIVNNAGEVITIVENELA